MSSNENLMPVPLTLRAVARSKENFGLSGVWYVSNSQLIKLLMMPDNAKLQTPNPCHAMVMLERLAIKLLITAMMVRALKRISLCSQVL